MSERDSDGPMPSDSLSDSDLEEHAIAARLREAREYVGLRQEQVAEALSIPRASVSAMESGKRRVTGLELRRLARLYRRSVSWLVGDDSPAPDMASALYRTTASLSDEDKEQVLKFAEFLASAGAPHRGSSGRGPGPDPS